MSDFLFHGIGLVALRPPDILKYGSHLPYHRIKVCYLLIILLRLSTYVIRSYHQFITIRQVAPLARLERDVSEVIRDRLDIAYLTRTGADMAGTFESNHYIIVA